MPHRTVGVFAEHVSRLVLKSVEIEWGSKPQVDWGMLVDLTPGTIGELVFDGFRSFQNLKPAKDTVISRSENDARGKHSLVTEV